MRRHPETSPDHSGEDKIEIEAGPREMTDAEYKAESLRSHRAVRMALERDLIDWQKRFEERQKEGMTDEQKKQYKGKIEELKRKIALAAKEKAEVEAAFEASERKRTA